MRAQRDLMERLAAADPLPDAELPTPEAQREAEALLARLLATRPEAGAEDPGARRPRERRWTLIAGVAAGAVAAAFAAITLVDSDAPGTGVVEKALAAVTQPDVVYHVLERTRAASPDFPRGERTFFSESWYTSDGRVHGKLFAASDGRRGMLLEEFAGRRPPGRGGGPALRYDPRENTIYPSAFGRAPDAEQVPEIDPFADPVAQLRTLQEQGRLGLAGTTRIAGRPAYRLVAGSTSRWRGFTFERVEYLVDSETYLPLARRVSARIDSERTYGLFTRYLVYESLPLDARNPTQLDLDPHTGATCAPGAGELRGNRGVGFRNPCAPAGEKAPQRAP
jgi:hypothetical protein